MGGGVEFLSDIDFYFQIRYCSKMILEVKNKA